MDTKLTRFIWFFPQVTPSDEICNKIMEGRLAEDHLSTPRGTLRVPGPNLKTTYLKGPIKQQYSISVVLENIHF